MSPNPQALAEDLPETDLESEKDFGEDDDWDPHTGTKPSPLDGEASDEHWDPRDDVEEAESEAFNTQKVKSKLVTGLERTELDQTKGSEGNAKLWTWPAPLSSPNLG